MPTHTYISVCLLVIFFVGWWYLRNIMHLNCVWVSIEPFYLSLSLLYDDDCYINCINISTDYAFCYPFVTFRRWTVWADEYTRLIHPSIRLHLSVLVQYISSGYLNCTDLIVYKGNNQTESPRTSSWKTNGESSSVSTLLANQQITFWNNEFTRYHESLQSIRVKEPNCGNTYSGYSAINVIFSGS